MASLVLFHSSCTIFGIILILILVLILLFILVLCLLDFELIWVLIVLVGLCVLSTGIVLHEVQLCLLDEFLENREPLVDDLLVTIQEMEREVVIVRDTLGLAIGVGLSLHGLGLVATATTPSIIEWDMEVGNLGRDPLIVRTQVDVDDVELLSAHEVALCLALEGFIGTHGTLGHGVDLRDWDDYGWLLWEGDECHLVFVDEEGELVQHKVSLDEAGVPLDVLVHGALQDDLARGVLLSTRGC